MSVSPPPFWRTMRPASSPARRSMLTVAITLSTEPRRTGSVCEISAPPAKPRHSNEPRAILRPNRASPDRLIDGADERHLIERFDQISDSDRATPVGAPCIIMGGGDDRGNFDAGTQKLAM